MNFIESPDGMVFVKRLSNNTPDVEELIRRLNKLEPKFNEARLALQKEISFKLREN